MRIHHIAVVLGGTAIISAPYGGSAALSNFYLVAILLTELSNPFMLLRSILKSMKLENTKAYTVIELIFVSGFIFNRSFFGIISMYNAWVSKLTLVAKITASTVYGVGIFWIFIIIQMIMKKVRTLSNNSLVRFIDRMISLLKKNRLIFIALIVIVSYILPYYLVFILGTGFMNIKYGNFVIV